ncbi:MAG: hypothetical protein WCJ56_11805 [bacterium]
MSRRIVGPLLLTIGTIALVCLALFLLVIVYHFIGFWLLPVGLLLDALALTRTMGWIAKLPNPRLPGYVAWVCYLLFCGRLPNLTAGILILLLLSAIHVVCRYILPEMGRRKQ